MNRILLIARREFAAYAKTVGFWLSLLAFPVFAVIGGAVPLLIQSSQPVRAVAVVERLSERLKAKNVVGDTVTLKLKSSGFRLRTRARHLMIPTQLANVIYETGRSLLEREVDGTAFRLIGIGVSGIDTADGSDPADLLEPAIARKAAAERAMDRVRNRFGREAVVRGKLYRHRPAPTPTEPDDDQNEGKTR